MNKLFKFLTTAALSLIFVSQAWAAATDVSVRISTPQTPTHRSSLDLNFVALDIQGRPMTAKCYKKEPSDGGFSQFGGDINLVAGGNSANCSVGSDIFDGEGTYQFYVTATAGGDSATSQTVSVDRNTSGPGTPTDYSKSVTGSCQYKIHFKTADDSGQTVKVELYRSDNSSGFTADASTRVETIGVGSNEAKDVFNTKPDCNKEYFYAVRAFDSAGNGSGLVGDTIITGGTTTTLTASPAPAIALTAPTGAILGEETETAVEPSPEPEGQVLSPDLLPESLREAGQVLGEGTNWPLWAGGLLALVLASWYAYKKFRQGAR
jgi:hypothetical protein